MSGWARAASWFAILLLTVPALLGADWPHWRGPGHDGKAQAPGLFGDEPFALELAWSRPLGIAYSGMAIVDGRLVTMFSDGEHDYLAALDAASGEEIWRYRIDTKFPAKGGSEGGPSSVPAIEDGVVYAIGPLGRIFAVRLEDGGELWALRADADLAAPVPHFGFASSPLVVGELVFVQVGGAGGHSLVALERKTGKTVWSTGADPVSFPSPILADLAGQLQIVAATDKNVMGLDRETGVVLWAAEHGNSNVSTAVPLGDNRFVVPGYKESAAFRVRSVDGRHTVEEIWRTTDLKGSFGAPVFHDGYLYGYSGDFLTCVSAEDGGKVWKSRAPGGHGLILVDGHLVILGADGAVVAAEASPEGYVEKARVRVFKRGSYTYPSFAEERVFVRNTRGIAAVSVRRGASSLRAEARDVAENDFLAFVREVERSDDKGKRIDAFIESQSGFPVVEDDRWVHFVYRGEAEDVAITGSMTEFRAEESLRRIPGTELFYRSYAIEPGARWEYRFNVDFEHPQPDPLNPRRAPAGDGEMSEVVTGNRVEPKHVRPYSGPRPGRVESLTIRSAALGGSRRVEVYLPAGYDDGDRSYPLLVLTDGDGWLRLAGLPDSLNHLIGNGVEPLIAAFVEKPALGAAVEFGGPRSADHVRMITDEVVPRLEKRYRLRNGRDSRAILGAGTGAMMSTYAAVLRPDVFGKAGACSVYLVDPLGKRLIGMLGGKDGSDFRSHFRVIWNRYEWKRAEWDLDIAEDSRRVVDALRAAGHDVVATEALDSAGWGAWRVQVAEMLRGFFPEGSGLQSKCFAAKPLD